MFIKSFIFLCKIALPAQIYLQIYNYIRAPSQNSEPRVTLSASQIYRPFPYSTMSQLLYIS
jgi:hypothetical protein